MQEIIHLMTATSDPVGAPRRARHARSEPSALPLWYASLALWIILSLADAVDYYAGWRFAGIHASYGRALAAAFPGWMVWAALSPIIFLAARRIRLTWPPAAGALLAHVGLSIAVGVVHTAVHASAGWAFGVSRATLTFGEYYSASLFDWMPINLMMYWAVVGAYYSLDYYRRYQHAQLEAAELSQRLTEATLAALQSQLHPHFLFNTLNAAVALIRTGDGGAATQVLTQLGDILRHLLYGNVEREIPLAAELAFLEQYLAIEQVRYSNRLRVVVDVPEALRTAIVPTLVLQPLVENAIQHGLNHVDASGQLSISARQEREMLILCVRNDGPPLPDAGTLARADGVGLANTRARLAHLHGDAARLTLADDPPNGVIATVVLPLRRAATAVAAQ